MSREVPRAMRGHIDYRVKAPKKTWVCRDGYRLMNRIVSMYWDNIDRRVVDAQRRVFEHFGFSIDQQERTGWGHGAFLDEYMAGLGEDDVVLLMDIDCFPLNREIVDKAFAAAREGRLFGCAQSSNHIDPTACSRHRCFLPYLAAHGTALAAQASKQTNRTTCLRS